MADDGSDVDAIKTEEREQAAESPMSALLTYVDPFGSAEHFAGVLPPRRSPATSTRSAPGLRDACQAAGVCRSSSSSGADQPPKAGDRMLDGRTWDDMPVPRRAATAP